MYVGLNTCYFLGCFGVQAPTFRMEAYAQYMRLKSMLQKSLFQNPNN